MRLPLLLLSLLILTSGSNAQTPSRSGVSAETLHSLLEKALNHFEQAQFSSAADCFAQIESDFGTEPETRDPDFLRRMLPIKGQAEFAAGRPATAAETLSGFTSRFPGDPHHPIALYTLALALQQNNQPEEALKRIIEFRQTHPAHSLQNLAAIQQVRLLLRLEQTDNAAEFLQTLPENDPRFPGLDQARLQLIRQLMKSGETGRATDLLLAQNWNPETTPEIASLSMTALELGDKASENGLHFQALDLYRLAQPRDKVLRLLDQHISKLSNPPRSRPNSNPFLQQELQSLLNRLTQQKSSLESGGDYTDSLLLRRGEAFLRTNRPHEAWLLFEQLSLSQSVPEPIREQAHFRWNMAASEIGLWEEALTIARYFLQLYPNSTLAPETLSLIAQAHQEQRRYDEAIEVLEDLRKHFPSHPLAQRWSFTLGFNKTALERYPEARADFKTAETAFPNGPLRPNAGLWHALTWFFERNYENALTELQQLSTELSSHPIHGEIEYRLTSTLYAMRDYEKAATAAENFIKNFPLHPRHAETKVLFGDILMGAGELDRATTVFEQIPAEMTQLHLYGLFQRGKILRAKEDFHGMIDLFSNYHENSESPKPRLSEALYWLGWAHSKLGEPEKAIPHLLKALDDFGNDPEAGGISSILNLLAPLTTQPELAATDFPTWLEQKRKQALDDEKFTWFSRLTFHLSQIAAKEGFPHRSEALLFEITAHTRPENLDPEILGETGQFLIRKNLQNGEDLLLFLLERYPKSPERALAFHGLGLLSFQNEDFENALRWFRTFQKETPGHPLAGEVFQLAGETALRLGDFTNATAHFEQILSLRNLRGRPHALALAGMAKASTPHDPHRAIAHYQRIYTMHLAQTDLVAEAYLESSLLFEKIGDIKAAHRTLTEMLAKPELTDLPPTEQARHLEKTLAAKLNRNLTLNNSPNP